MVSVSEDATMRMWSLSDRCQLSLKNCIGEAFCLLPTANGRYLITGHNGNFTVILNPLREDSGVRIIGMRKYDT